MASHSPPSRTSVSFLPHQPSPLIFPPISADPDIDRPPHVPVPYPPVKEEPHHTNMGRDALQYPPEARLRYPPGIRRPLGMEYTTPSWVQPRRPDWVGPRPPSWAESKGEEEDLYLVPLRRSRRHRNRRKCATLPPLEARARFLAGASPLFIESGSRLRSGPDIFITPSQLSHDGQIAHMERGPGSILTHSRDGHPRLRTVSSMQGTIGHECYHADYFIAKEPARNMQSESHDEVDFRCEGLFCDFSRLMEAFRPRFRQKPKNESASPPSVMRVHFPHDKPTNSYHHPLSDWAWK